MELKQLLIAALGAAALSLVATASQAAPAGSTKLNEATSPAIERVAMHCRRSGGAQRCRDATHRYGYRSRYRELNNPDAYRTGSSHWWQEMDRLDRGGRGGRH